MASRTRIKICGCTSEADIELAVAAGADAVGVILAPSHRQLRPAQAEALVAAVPPFVAAVAVLVDPDPALVARVRAWGAIPQFHGRESPAFAESAGRYVKALHVDPNADRLSVEIERTAEAYVHGDLLFDTRAGASAGGSGVPFPWPLVASIARRRRVIVSGGLTPGNVAQAIAAVRPFAVDVRSGVETDGRKDANKVRAFVRAVRESDETT